MQIRRIFEYALQREVEGKRFFDENTSRMKHAAAVDAFKKLAAEEQKHIEYVQAQIDRLTNDEPIRTTPLAEGDSAIFADRAVSENLDQSVSEAMVADLPVLRMAYLIERDFAEFYESAARHAEGAAREALETLAHWERQHEEIFKEMHDRIFEQYAQMPWGG
ncbi:MAG: ferritin family protein [Anaerolineales bacterium]|nr:ferritin family protein [Anaerolineales bacterium]